MALCVVVLASSTTGPNGQPASPAVRTAVSWILTQAHPAGPTGPAGALPPLSGFAPARSIPDGSPRAVGSRPLAGPNSTVAEFDFYFGEVGLAYATNWTVELVSVPNTTLNASMSSTNNNIGFVEPLGIYLYYIPAVPGYLESFYGNITANFTYAASINIVVQFHPYPPWAPAPALTGIALWSVLSAVVAVTVLRRR